MQRFRVRWAVFGATFLFAGVPCARADIGAGGGTFFNPGQTRLSLSGGYGEWNNNSYGIVGAGVGYFLMQGLEAGVDTEAWIGNKPHLYDVSPELRYIFTQFEQFKPYIGGFYSRSFFDTHFPLDSAGGRAGVVSPLSSNTYLSLGIVYEHYLNCDSNFLGDCTQVYPEIGFAFSH